MNIKVPRPILLIWAVVYPLLMIFGFCSWLISNFQICVYYACPPDKPPVGVFALLFHPAGIIMGLVFYRLTLLALKKEGRLAGSKMTNAQFDKAETETDESYATRQIVAPNTSLANLSNLQKIFLLLLFLLAGVGFIVFPPSSSLTSLTLLLDILAVIIQFLAGSLSLFQTLAWPAMVLVVIIMLRKPITNLIVKNGRLARSKVADSQFDKSKTEKEAPSTEE